MNIDKLLKKTGLSINELCSVTGITRDMIYKWRKNHRVLPISRRKSFEYIEWLHDHDLLTKYIKENTE